MRLTLSRGLLAFGLFVATAFLSALAIMGWTLQTVRIEGPAYTQIIHGKDLVADILPPPMFLVEAYLLESETAFDSKLGKENAVEIEKLRAQYSERMKVWHETDLPKDIRALIDDGVAPASDAFWKTIDEAYLPALSSGDAARTTQAITELRQHFQAQKSAVQQLVGAATTFLSASEGHARDLTRFYAGLAIAAGAAALLSLVGGLLVFRRLAITPLEGLSDYMQTLASGSLETEVPFVGRNDEVGDMARSVAVFRQAGIDKIAIENDNRRQQQHIERERAERLNEQENQARNLQKVVDELGAGLDRLSKFNIRYTLDDPFQPEFEQLRHDFNKSLGVFQDTMSLVLEKSNEIDDSSNALQQAADQMAKRTEKQAATLEETAAALEEVSGTVKTSSSRLAGTRDLTREAKSNVEKSAYVVSDAIEAMQRIEAASASIGNITGVIDQIAFQTNLLALNAGVEAARAGEAGKGFAVVAQEVRELAQRSASAAKEISALIAQSTREVSAGVALVNDTGSALRAIEASINTINQDIEAVTYAAQEQATGLSEITSAVNEMDQLTQQNAAMVEETSAATHALADEVTELVRLVGQFVFNRRHKVRDSGEDNRMTEAKRGDAPPSRLRTG
ncbi:methyl-accepting chemotaxis protein [Rhizobium sp. S-51]|uniref:Methyl-accepting chemotaxis protein n=1 Tax=Rhizobium terricola TaxID=2728849 RepID=A0A7Y0ASY5_9HYPH|nr:methyl-accepting chemotaxis protein [Rhizobium terricola]NML72918.1 methyl-accepting chemotaxis protein [Rhizobium terricola]